MKKTICRARPKYLSIRNTEEAIALDTGYKEREYNRFYLNSASEAFKLFLESYILYFNKTPNIAIQSFTCLSMLEAIINSGAYALIYDIRLEDLSIDFESIDFNEIDILVLTSYQGIPCCEYGRVADICKKNGVLLVEDLSHGCMSKSNGIQLGTKSDLYIESFYFDKPFSSLQGGRLVINTLEPGFMTFISKKYERIKRETDSHAIRDIQLLRFLLEYTAEENYRETFDYSNFIKYPFLVRLWNKRLFENNLYVCFIRIIYKVLCRLDKNKTTESTGIYKLNDKKIYLIELQEKSFQEYYKNKSIDFSQLLDIDNSFEERDSDIVWNRYSVIDEKGSIKEKLKKDGLCVGNFNWTKCLHQYGELRCTVKSDCKVSEYVSENILNIPVWQLM